MYNFVLVVLVFVMGLLAPMKVSPVVKVQYEVISTTVKQLKCLTDVIYYEARDESYEAQLGVATVVMNRVENADYPNTICGVVYQRNPRGCQFSWVCVPHRIAYPKQYIESRQLAMNVLFNNIRLSSVRDALFFHTTAVSPSWDKDMELIDSIGVQLFYGPKKKAKEVGT